MRDTAYRYIQIDESGVVVVGLEGLEVVKIVLDYTVRGLDPQQIADQYELKLSAVHSALAYYHDHAEEIDREIKRRLDLEMRLRNELEQPELANRLREYRSKKRA